MVHKMNIVVLCAGTSTEREVSIVSGSKVCEALIQKGHNARVLDIYFGTYSTGDKYLRIKKLNNNSFTTIFRFTII